MREEIVMEEQTVIHSTFVIERSFARSPERVFSAFADATKGAIGVFRAGGSGKP